MTHYMLFGLRDADSSKPDLFHQFGILHDDYTPKPAFDTFRALVAELGPTDATREPLAVVRGFSRPPRSSSSRSRRPRDPGALPPDRVQRRGER